MGVHKRKYRSGQVVWHFAFSLPGSTREQRLRVTGSGYATRAEAVQAEAARRIEEQKKREQSKSSITFTAPLPTTLSMLMEEFLSQHVDKKLAPKTVERYHEQAAYLDPALMAMPINEITPLHLTREWKRLLERGGHHRHTRVARPLSAKTVRNVAGILSSAFSRAVKWSLASNNPVPLSEPPVPKKHRGIALTPAQQRMLIEAAGEPLGTFLEVCAGTGARRGEVLALRWADIQEGRALIARSLSQTKETLEFKATKTEDSARPISLPASTITSLEEHRTRQNEFRSQFGPAYRADFDLIFTNPDGTPLKPDSVSASISALCRRLKFPKGVSLHTLRHTHGSHLLAKGVPLPVVSERLGHSSVRVTADVYSHAIRGQDDEAAKRWESFQQENGASKPLGGVQ